MSRRPLTDPVTSKAVAAPGTTGLGVLTIATDDGPVQLDVARLVAFVDALRVHRTVRIDREALWVAFHAAFPHAPPGPAERRWMLAALMHASANGVITFPAARGPRWDRATRPALPSSVDRVAAEPAPVDDAWRQFPWHPTLAWVPELGRLPEDAVRFLRRVHDGLVREEFQTPAPLKYRSLALTGDEKRLAKLADGVLFGPGRLSYETLGCLPNLHPIAWESVGDRTAVLVFENAEPVIVALAVLRAWPASPYGVVAWGHGTSVAQSIQWLGRIGRPITQIHYVGDLDRPGLDAALNADRHARAAGLPAVHSAPGLHAAMLDAAVRFDHPDGWPYVAPGADPADAARVAFLPEPLRARALAILAAGRRVAEEVLGPTELARAWGLAGT